MLLRMRNEAGNGEDKGKYGRALYAYCERQWEGEQSTLAAWARRHQFTASTVGRWRGSDPAIGTWRHIAEALDVTMIELLVIMGVVTKEEASIPARDLTVQDDALDALAHNASERKILADLVAGFARMRADAQTVTVSDDTKGAARRRRGTTRK